MCSLDDFFFHCSNINWKLHTNVHGSAIKNKMIRNNVMIKWILKEVLSLPMRFAKNVEQNISYSMGKEDTSKLVSFLLYSLEPIVDMHNDDCIICSCASTSLNWYQSRTREKYIERINIDNIRVYIRKADFVQIIEKFIEIIVYGRLYDK